MLRFFAHGNVALVGDVPVGEGELHRAVLGALEISVDILHLVSLAGVGLISGFLAGLLGIGGGVVIIPLLIYVGGVPIKLATGVSVVQAFFATASGLVIHRRARTVDVRLGLVLGGAGIIGGLLGALGSAAVNPDVLLLVFLALVVVAIVLLFVAPRGDATKIYTVNVPLSFLLGGAVGVLAGMLGVGGGFIMTPLMISVLKVPTRVAVGTSLLMILPTTVSGSVGKIMTGQFDLETTAAVVVGSIVGAQFGGKANTRLAPRRIRLILTLLLFAILIRTIMDLLGI